MDKFRMFQWCLAAVVFYFIATHVSHPQLQIVMWKLGHITIASFLGYWIDRVAFKYSRIDHHSHPMHHIRRALIVIGSMIAAALGL